MKEESINLSCKEGGSDKVYNLQLKDVSTGWSVCFQYGRRGTSLNNSCKVENIAYDDAKKVYDRLVKEKNSKGYKGSGETQSATSTVSTMIESRDTGCRPQLLNDIPEEDVEKYLTDDNWCAQEKYDGRRRMIIRTGSTTVPTNRKGQTVAIDSAIIHESVSLLPNGILDGEDMGDYIMLFDLLQVGVPYKTRYLELQRLFKGFINDKLKLVTTAWTTGEKRDLLEKLRKENAEGIVFKRVDAGYVPGRPNSGGDQLKYKFCATATCWVNGINPTKRSVSLNVNDREGQAICVGNVTVYPNQEIPKAGSIVEVRYLYYFQGGSLFQPVLLGCREDADISDCTLSQLKVKREENVTEG